MVTCCSSPHERTKTETLGRWAGWVLVPVRVGEDLGEECGAIREHGREKLGLECGILAGRLF